MFWLNLRGGLGPEKKRRECGIVREGLCLQVKQKFGGFIKYYFIPHINKKKGKKSILNTTVILSVSVAHVM